MKFVRFKYENRISYGVLNGELVLPIKDKPYSVIEYTGESLPLSHVKLIAPAEPSKIVAIGKNYKAHADEMGEGRPTEPLLFLKPSTCIVGNEDNVVYPAISNRLDYEGELGVIIGKTAHNIKEGESSNYIFGYTCLNDITARDIQKSDPQWTRGKSFDTFCPIGPHIETELAAMNTGIRTRVNGEIKQNSNTSCMTHDIDKLICYITQCMTLLPGDIIATGTPEGIGSMQRGDIVEVEIDGIGVLRNKIV